MNLGDIKNIIIRAKQIYPISDNSINLFAGNLVEHHFRKHHVLTRPGVRDNSVYFIEKGIARSYLLIKGKEITNWFTKEGDVVFSSNALYYGSPGFEYIEILEHSHIYSISIDKMNTLYESNIEIANWSRCLHQEVLLKMQALHIDRFTLSAKERYEKFCKESPDLINRINLGLIVSYLGMTQQHLSSLRAAI
ncbi:Crp/Fnr family transcriptional regulator [Muricauda sp. SCSIO 64092]|uniref:Crp/Fnr family transcriptional regulator n=1 Tax=Allomuricauda sp. SCSIO 64092 TaxID=2908842 RepID=UPI001FF44A08|nr:Crp/Fnr family transcriptional regulator [Muricauda sp. SCSIO 64092]UOY08268.1 Crp/Fnr family transcriptional regulator [Muricauda sp. SCSIO 64092]